MRRPLFRGSDLARCLRPADLGAMRVGLLTRWMGVLGIFSAVLIFLPIGGATLELVPSFWMVATAILYAGRWPNGMPAAWEAGEARPWPTQAQVRAERQAAAGQQNGKRKPADEPAPAGPEQVAPAPAQPAGGSSRRRRRKRSARR